MEDPLTNVAPPEFDECKPLMPTWHDEDPNLSIRLALLDAYLQQPSQEAYEDDLRRGRSESRLPHGDAFRDWYAEDLLTPTTNIARLEGELERLTAEADDWLAATSDYVVRSFVEAMTEAGLPTPTADSVARIRAAWRESLRVSPPTLVARTPLNLEHMGFGMVLPTPWGAPIIALRKGALRSSWLSVAKLAAELATFGFGVATLNPLTPVLAAKAVLAFIECIQKLLRKVNLDPQQLRALAALVVTEATLHRPVSAVEIVSLTHETSPVMSSAWSNPVLAQLTAKLTELARAPCHFVHVLEQPLPLPLPQLSTADQQSLSCYPGAALYGCVSGVFASAEKIVGVRTASAVRKWA